VGRTSELAARKELFGFEDGWTARLTSGDSFLLILASYGRAAARCNVRSNPTGYPFHRSKLTTSKRRDRNCTTVPKFAEG
jgi:hypothetical protein